MEAQRELENLKAKKEQRRAMRKKKTVQKAKQQAGIELGSEDEFEPRENPSVSPFFLFLCICESFFLF